MIDDNLIKRKVKMSCSKIYENYKLIRDIDLCTGIDFEKSGILRTDREKQSVTFIYTKKGEINYKDLFASLGHIEQTNQGVRLVADINKDYYNSEWLCNLFTKDMFSPNEIDIVYLDFKLEGKVWFVIRFANEPYREKEVEAYNKKTRIGNLQSNRKIKGVDYGFSRCGIIYSEWISEPANSHKKFENYSTYESVELTINNKQNYILLGKEKFTTNGVKLINTGRVGITLGVYSICGDTALIKSFGYGSSEGYLYLKPLQLDQKAAKVFVLGNYDVKKLQYQDTNGIWHDCAGEISSLYKNQKLILRVGMTNGDKIYKIIITEA